MDDGPLFYLLNSQLSMVNYKVWNYGMWDCADETTYIQTMIFKNRPGGRSQKWNTPMTDPFIPLSNLRDGVLLTTHRHAMIHETHTQTSPAI